MYTGGLHRLPVTLTLHTFLLMQFCGSSAPSSEKVCMYTKETVLEDIQQNQIELIDLQFTDILGAIKSVTIPSEHLEDVFERGLWFDGSSIYGFARIQESDMLLPDPVTYRVLPWVQEPP